MFRTPSKYLKVVSYPSSALTDGDISKAESANKVLETLIADLSKVMKEICDWRKNLFDKDMNIKSWKASELKFLNTKKNKFREHNSISRKDAIIYHYKC